MSGGLGDEVGRDGSLVRGVDGSRGGGSMNVDETDGTMDSGRKGISSDADDVSIVMWLVGFVPCLSV